MELRRGKAGASACSAVGRGGAVARRAGRRCAGKSRAVRELLQCGGCRRIRTGAAGPRVEDVGSRQSEGSGRGEAALRVAHGGYGDGPGASGLWFARRQRGLNVS
jgi:hypothetical protein